LTQENIETFLMWRLEKKRWVLKETRTRCEKAQTSLCLFWVRLAVSLLQETISTLLK